MQVSISIRKLKKSSKCNEILHPLICHHVTNFYYYSEKWNRKMFLPTPTLQTNTCMSPTLHAFEIRMQNIASNFNCLDFSRIHLDQDRENFGRWHCKLHSEMLAQLSLGDWNDTRIHHDPLEFRCLHWKKSNGRSVPNKISLTWLSARRYWKRINPFATKVLYRFFFKYFITSIFK